MKLAKFARMVIREGYVRVYKIRERYMQVFTTRDALFVVSGLPEICGDNEMRTILDIDKKKWDAVDWDIGEADIANVEGIDLRDAAPGEELLQYGEERLSFTFADPMITESKRLCFVDKTLFAPVLGATARSYTTYWRRQTAGGSEYVVAKDGMNLVAAALCPQVLDDNFLKLLSNFQSLCICELEYRREMGVLTRAETLEELQGGEQTDMDDEKESGAE